MEEIRRYAALFHAPISTLARAILRAKLIEAKQQGRLSLELGKVEVELQ